MRAVYPSDITREQFEAIRYILASARKVTCPRRYNIYDVFCAIQYILREGCHSGFKKREKCVYRRGKGV